MNLKYLLVLLVVILLMRLIHFILLVREISEPIFLFEKLKIFKVKVLDNKHISNIFVSKNGFSISSISFNSINESIGTYLLNYKKEINVIGYLKYNFWNNKKTLQLVVRDLII